MAVPEHIRKAWIEVQKRYSHPVNAIGLKIDSRDTMTLRVWKEAGIDKFVKN